MSRVIRPELESFMDKRILELYGVGAFRVDANELLVRAASTLVGVREKPNKSNDGPIVRLINDTVGGPEPIPWCMAAVQSCVAYVEKKMQVKSPLVASEHCMTTWRGSKQLAMPVRRGTICIWNYVGSDRGHTGIVESVAVQSMRLYEGNTGGGINGSDIVREGDGFYHTSRPTSSTKTMKLVGFLDPFRGV